MPHRHQWRRPHGASRRPECTGDAAPDTGGHNQPPAAEEVGGWPVPFLPGRANVIRSLHRLHRLQRLLGQHLAGARHGRGGGLAGLRRWVSSLAVPEARAAAGSLWDSTTLGDRLVFTSGGDTYIRSTRGDATSLTVVRRLARKLCQTNPYAVHLQRLITTNVVGPSGIRLQCNIVVEDDQRLMKAAPAKDEVRCRVIEKLWQRFCRADVFDLSGLRSFRQFEWAICDALSSDGDIFVRIVHRAVGRNHLEKKAAKICFELIGAHRLDINSNNISTRPGHIWRSGIEYNRDGRRTAYAFFSSDLDQMGHYPFTDRSVILPAENVLHICLKRRSEQVRGIPAVLPAITTLQNIDLYEESHWQRKHLQSNITGYVIRKPDEDDDLSVGASLVSAQGQEQAKRELQTAQRITEAPPGSFIQCEPGEEPRAPEWGPEDTTFPDTIKLMLRRIAAACGVSYSSLSRDFSDTNYSSSKLSEQQDRDNWLKLQQELIEQFHQPVFESWLDAAFHSGALPFSLFSDYLESRDKYCYPRWQGRTWSHIDPAKEMIARRTERELGIVTQAQQIAEHSGKDYEEVMRQLAYEHQHRIELGLPPFVADNGREEPSRDDD
ncbi:MAG: phage portal protein [Aphanocapsa feldmannii 277cI]|uniref:Phage portal protein n=1 Tax=Aphanocapsa feldmannii 277cI TaxID=2507554 RepID=A0A524RVZ8_9CHRO|nr:MAG: phage portal protein [Aphanocapsa feldmannii 277cI]